MTLSKNDLKIIIPFLLFIAGGVLGNHSVNYIESHLALLKSFKWFTIPSIIIALYYSYRGTFGSENKIKIPFWRNALAFLAMTFICTIMFLVSFQGYLILYNCNIGPQTKTIVKGEVIKLHYPTNKKLLNKYSIDIKIDSNLQVMKLEVPDNNYTIGQTFEKEMTVGSLGFLYSK